MRADYRGALSDIVEGVANWEMWGRLGWQEVRRRYRLTVIGPFWTTLSLGIFIFTLGIVWAQLWKQDPKTYLPFLAAGMISWGLVSQIINDGCSVFIAAEALIKQLRFPYTSLSCMVVYRNLITFAHNFAIFVIVILYAGTPVNWSTLLIVPGFLLVCITGLWVATLFGLVCARYRDVQQVVASIVQVSMFITPIFWKPEQLGDRFTKFVDYNFLYHYIDIIRGPLLGRAPAMRSWYVAIVGTVLGWLVTLFVYSRFRRRLAYWL